MEHDFSRKKREDLIKLCKERNIKGYSGKKKEDIITLLTENSPIDISIPDNLDIYNLKIVDLFAGTGAFTLAFEDAKKANVVFANDIVKYSKIIYDENFKHKLTLEDLNEIKNENIPKHNKVYKLYKTIKSFLYFTSARRVYQSMQ